MKSKSRVLFLGSDPADKALIELVLRGDLPDVEVVLIEDPIAFGREVERADFDLVVCEERLSWIDGVEALLEVRQRHPAAAVVILRQERGSERKGREVGQGLFLPKSSAGFLQLPSILQEALEEAEARGNQSRIEPRIRRLLELSRVGVFRCTLSGQLLDADDTFLEILGAQSLEEAQQLDLAGLTPRNVRGFTETGKIYKREQSLSGVDGRLVQVAFTELVSLDEDGMPVLDGLLEDVGDRSSIQPGLREEADRLARSNKQLQAFSSLVAHELKEPLRSVEQSTHLMLEDSADQLEERALASADRVLHGVQRLRSMIDGLLTLARTGGDESHIESCDCNDLVQEVLDGLRVQVQESQAKITVNPLPTVRADPAQLQLVFRNLLSNSIKFHGEEPPSIDVAAKQGGEEWVFSVRDRGTGIEPSIADRIFESFTRSGQSAGSGLGLTICKEVVERHGGRIWAESPPQGGTVFYFTIPLFSTRSEEGGGNRQGSGGAALGKPQAETG